MGGWDRSVNFVASQDDNKYKSPSQGPLSQNCMIGTDAPSSHTLHALMISNHDPCLHPEQPVCPMPNADIDTQVDVLLTISDTSILPMSTCSRGPGVGFPWKKKVH